MRDLAKKVKSISCYVCQRTFTVLSNLTRHIKTVHKKLYGITVIFVKNKHFFINRKKKLYKLSKTYKYWEKNFRIILAYGYFVLIHYTSLGLNTEKNEKILRPGLNDKSLRYIASICFILI